MTSIIPIDISNNPEILSLVKEVASTKKSRLLRISGENVALLTPVKPTKKRRTKPEKTLGEYDRFLLGVGAWKDINAEEMSIGEIYEGAFSYADPQAHLKIFRQFLSSFTLLNLNEPIMQRFAEIRSFLRRRGEIISDFDILIGATALHHGLTLLTYNTRHFKRIPDLQFYPPTA